MISHHETVQKEETAGMKRIPNMLGGIALGVAAVLVVAGQAQAAGHEGHVAGTR